MVISERATLEHAVTKLGEQRDHLLEFNETTKQQQIFLKNQLIITNKELQKYSIDIRERERRESEMTEVIKVFFFLFLFLFYSFILQ